MEEEDFMGDVSRPHSSPPKSQVRGKTDIAWDHCKQILEAGINGNKKKLVCLYCGKTFAGGGINRVKQHLAGLRGDVDSCRKVPPDVRFNMKENLDNFAAKLRKIQEVLDECNPHSSYYREQEEQNRDLHNNDVQEIIPPSSNESDRKRVGAKVLKEQKGIDSYFMPRTRPDELHFDDLDLDGDVDGDGDENRFNTNNENDDFSMTETPSLVQNEGIDEFMSDTPAWMRSNSS